jgi:hypothetical protein
VKYKDGRVGLLDTKAGLPATESTSRAEGLASYISKQNKNGSIFTMR